MNQPVLQSPAINTESLSAAAGSVTTPADLFGELFVRVQMTKIFPDGKTFADATPRQSPEDIMRAFALEQPPTPEALRRFIVTYFELPSPPEPVPPFPCRDMSGHIRALWPRLERTATESAAGSSKITLPEPFVIPGGRFREIYYWDSYFTMLGLLQDGRSDLVDAMLRDFESLIERFGLVPNGTRTYFLSRSQPPFLALMAALSSESGDTAERRLVAALRREHAYWMDGADQISDHLPVCKSVVRMPDGSLLNRYWDTRDTPRDESYAEDVETAARSGRPTREVYRDLRAGAASGWDFSARWFDDPQDLASIRATDIVPIDLNSLLWKLEMEIARRSLDLGLRDDARAFTHLAAKRAAAIHAHLWVSHEGRFADYNLRSQTVTRVLSAASLYPLFLHLATTEQAATIAQTTRDKLLAPGGLRTTLLRTGQQWDAPNGWAPLQWIAIVGLEHYGHSNLARAIAQRWLNTVAQVYRETGKMMEKYDVEDMRPGGGGEYPLQDGFGWTNGVTQTLLNKYPDLAPDA